MIGEKSTPPAVGRIPLKRFKYGSQIVLKQTQNNTKSLSNHHTLMDVQGQLDVLETKSKSNDPLMRNYTNSLTQEQQNNA